LAGGISVSSVRRTWKVARWWRDLETGARDGKRTRSMPVAGLNASAMLIVRVAGRGRRKRAIFAEGIKCAH